MNRGWSSYTRHNILELHTSLPPLVFLLLVVFCELAKLSRRAWLLGREKSWYEYYEEFFQSLALILSI
jgi:hypothetical protein